MQLGFTLLDDETGELNEFRFTDKPLTRGTLAVIEQFKDDRQKAMALMMRIHGLTDLLHDERMKPFIRDGAELEALEIRTEVFEVAATEPFDNVRGFKAHKFFRKVKAKIEAQHGA